MALSLHLKQCGAAKSDLLRREIDADIAFEEAKCQLQEAQLDIEDEEREARWAEAREHQEELFEKLFKEALDEVTREE